VAGVIYYEGSTGRYMEKVNGQWLPVDSRRMVQILQDKAYIDMPNNTSYTFLHPRQIFYGLRLSFDLN